ncbi:hypothetical protein [Paraburkholderia terrae]|uniref:hypothetical protein n=1 Tax=Paraburkholderia terrae TaxID=311230 RepID=UPI0020BE7460|nr:hypothetical protein [Paraburkholderia terrae]
MTRLNRAGAATQLLPQAGCPGSEYLRCCIYEAMMIQTASEAGVSLAAKRAVVDRDIGLHGHRFRYSKRDAKAYPHKLARLRMRVHQAGCERSLLIGNDEDGRQCFKDVR